MPFAGRQHQGHQVTRAYGRQIESCGETALAEAEQFGLRVPLSRRRNEYGPGYWRHRPDARACQDVRSDQPAVGLGQECGTK